MKIKTITPFFLKPSLFLESATSRCHFPMEQRVGPAGCSSSVNGREHRRGQLPRWLTVKESSCQCRRRRGRRFDHQVRKIPWRRARQPTPVFLPGECHGHRSLAGCRESDTTERLTKLARTGWGQLALVTQER